jgi:hypothetical protein
MNTLLDITVILKVIAVGMGWALLDLFLAGILSAAFIACIKTAITIYEKGRGND